MAQTKFKEWKDCVHPATRTICIGFSEAPKGHDPGELNSADVDRVICGIHALESMGDGRITLKFQCIGGDVYLGLALYDAIRASLCPITMMVYGRCMSMGVAILQAAKIRLLMPNTTLMVHAGTTQSKGHPKEVEIEVKESKRLDRIYNQILSERSGLPIKKVQQLCLWTKYLSAEQSVDMGFADGIYRL